MQSVSTKPRRPRRRSAEQARVERYAYHEAGHAIVAVFLGIDIIRISMTPRENAGAYSVLEIDQEINEIANGSRSGRCSSRAEDYLMVLLAGPVAAAIYEDGRMPRWWVFGLEGERDLEYVRRLIAARYGEDADSKKLIRQYERNVRDILSSHWRKVEQLAKHLRPGAELDGREIDAILLDTRSGVAA